MYHWSVSQPSGYFWSFRLKDGDRLITHVGCIELHVQYEHQNITRMMDASGNEFHIPTGPRLGEIHIFHIADNQQVEYLEEMFVNPPNLTMELLPNLNTETANVFTGVRLASVEYHVPPPVPHNLTTVEVRWIFTGSSMLSGITDNQNRPGIMQHLLNAEPEELIEMEARLNGWAPMEEPVQKLDWQEFGF